MNPAELRDPNCASRYAAQAIAVTPRLLSLLDRQSQSQTFGSFDREHWGWKFRDFPITMLQTAICPLAAIWRHSFPRNAYYRNPQLIAWIEAAIRNTCARQHGNGAFDSVAPYTQSHGVTLAIVHCLTETLRLLDRDLSPAIADLIRATVRRACRFSLRSAEDYAFISNHQALFALAWLNASELLSEPEYEKKSRETIESILRHQSADGWYREYDGADPGYESLGLGYLAQYWQRTRSPRVLDSLRRSIEFYAHCVHPDGSVGGGYGSRHTQLYFPAGFEILAPEIPLAARIAVFMREKLDCGNVLTPSAADSENLPALTDAYVQAAIASRRDSADAVPQLPCESLLGSRRFSDSGLVFVGTSAYYAVVNALKGGACRIFNRRTNEIAYENSGYLVTTTKKKWSSQHLGAGKITKAAPNDELACESVFTEVQQKPLTPAKFLLLRALNLTLCRNYAISDWLQTVIIRSLIRKAKPGPFRLRRLVRFAPETITFSDEIELAGSIQIQALSSPRSFLSIHMGSAKYFYSSDLVAIPEPPLDGLVRELNEKRIARCEFTLRFSDAGVPEHDARPSAEERVTVEMEAYPPQ